MLYLVSFANNLDIVVHYDKSPSGFLLTPIRMTLNDRERPIHLKVRLARTARLKYVGLCCGFQS